MSSGCATIASARLQSSGSGSSGGGVSMGSSMPRIRLAAQGRTRLAGCMAEIADLDVSDDAAREFYDVEAGGPRGRPPVCRPPHVSPAGSDGPPPEPYYRRILLAAREGGRMVGTADLGLSAPGQPPPGAARGPRAAGSPVGGVSARALHDEVWSRGREPTAGRPSSARPSSRRRAEPSPSLLFARALGLRRGPPRGPPPARAPAPGSAAGVLAGRGARLRHRHLARSCPRRPGRDLCGDAHPDGCATCRPAASTTSR